jgi:hypothetical protein
MVALDPGRPPRRPSRTEHHRIPQIWTRGASQPQPQHPAWPDPHAWTAATACPSRVEHTPRPPAGGNVVADRGNLHCRRPSSHRAWTPTTAATTTACTARAPPGRPHERAPPPPAGAAAVASGLRRAVTGESPPPLGNGARRHHGKGRRQQRRGDAGVWVVARKMLLLLVCLYYS